MDTFPGFVREVLEPTILPVYRTPYHGRHGPEARLVHGAVHVSRCVIFAEAMMACYVHLLDVRAARFDALAIRLALGWHDAGREGDGVDRWERESGNLAREHVARLGLPAAFGDYVSSLIVHYERRPDDPNAHIVQACDTLDVLRVFPGRAFERDRLAFLHQSDPLVAERAPPPGLRDALIAEAERWIEETEGFFQHSQYDGSATCCQDLLRDLDAASGKFPTLCSLLEGPARIS